MALNILQAMLDPALVKPLAETALTVVVGATAWLQKRSDAKTRAELSTQIEEQAAATTGAIAAHAEKTEERFDALDRGVSEVRAIVVGPDGRNGIRGRIEEIRADVKDLQKVCAEAGQDRARDDERIRAAERWIDGVERRKT